MTDLKSLRERLVAQCKAWGLKGTILLSTEGINLFVAGATPEIEALLAELRAVPGLEDLAPKISDSTEQPFTRMLVRIKKEIIAFGVEGIDPGRRTSPKLSAQTLKQWLDEGRDITLLDTRNDYEVKLGTFKGATAAGIDHFREFPQAVAKLPPELKERPIVMFCTGGIRCEKAGPYMEREGFKSIFQLDGGILKYFEECGGQHYQGECFVFDQRVGVDPALRETESSQCYACQTPLDADDQADPKFVAGISCPYCFKPAEEKAREQVQQRNAAIREAITPLPGSTPEVNRRPISISEKYAGHTLIDFLSEVFVHIPRETWLSEIARHSVVDQQGNPANPHHRLRPGERFYRVQYSSIEPEVNGNIQILHEDDAIIVLNKPAPLPMHPCGRFHRNTLQHILDIVYAPFQPRHAHRLDSNTSGIVVCTRTRRYARLLQPQFAAGEVDKLYMARVFGHPPEDQFACDAPISAEPGKGGLRDVDHSEGQPARTEFEVIRRLSDGTAIVHARPLTGRTNQIRVHLWDCGYPIKGDPAYLTDRKNGTTMTLSPNDPPLCLHAWKLGFKHPVTQQRVAFAAPLPGWAEAE